MTILKNEKLLDVLAKMSSNTKVELIRKVWNEKDKEICKTQTVYELFNKIITNDYYKNITIDIIEEGLANTFYLYETGCDF